MAFQLKWVELSELSITELPGHAEVGANFMQKQYLRKLSASNFLSKTLLYHKKKK
jgi:hypothetical protein